jgi:hypothetical protein
MALVSKTYARGGTSARSKVLVGVVEMDCASFHSLTRSPEKCSTEAKGATRSISMMDILMLALGFGFFALAIGYTYACERL